MGGDVEVSDDYGDVCSYVDWFTDTDLSIDDQFVSNNATGIIT